MSYSEIVVFMRENHSTPEQKVYFCSHKLRRCTGIFLCKRWQRLCERNIGRVNEDKNIDIILKDVDAWITAEACTEQKGEGDESWGATPSINQEILCKIFHSKIYFFNLNERLLRSSIILILKVQFNFNETQ